MLDTGKTHARIHANTCWYVLNTYQYHRSVLGMYWCTYSRMYSHVLMISTCLYIPNTQAIRAKYVPIQTGMYQYIPGMYQYMPSIRTEIHTKIHTNIELWYWYVSVCIKFQYVHYTFLMEQRNKFAHILCINKNFEKDRAISILVELLRGRWNKRWNAIPSQCFNFFRQASHERWKFIHKQVNSSVVLSMLVSWVRILVGVQGWGRLQFRKSESIGEVAHSSDL